MSLLEQTKLRPMGTMPFKRALPMRSSQEPCDSGLAECCSEEIRDPELPKELKIRLSLYFFVVL